MIILIQDRKDNYHLSDYTPSSGSKYTLCGKIYLKSDIINTLALDNSIPDICRTCHELHETMYLDDLEYDPRMAKSQLQRDLEYKYRFTLNQAFGPEMVYSDVVSRNWRKLNKYQRKVTRK